MIGKTLSHYRILQELGAGGMGKVYLAEDTKLHRRVALKVLPPELAGSAERLERFEREARTLAALDHPNIVTIHSVEEAEGVRFLTMAHVQGKTLGESIPPDGLELDSLLELALALTEGLRAAHERGIVHRDLKPANVMVDADGRLRILDFGLAKLQPKPMSVISSQAPTEMMSPEMTREGSILGTYPYMSPEQVEGRPADARSDLFSFGVILYEMATGERPFSGESPASLISSILRDRPKPLATTRPRLPARLGEIVERCLAKDPAKRFQSAEDLRDALAELSQQVAAGEARPTPSGLLRATRWGVATLGAIVLLVALLAGGVGLWRAERPPPAAEENRIASLAVLPLRNGSGDPEQAYLVDGITEALITDLSKIGALKVISRSSTMRYKDTEKTAGEIAVELGVDALVEGSVTREGDQVGIMVQLREAHGERALWGERYVRDLTSVLALQGEIARTVAAEIEVSLTPEEETQLATVREVDPEAYEAYARGMYYLREVTPEGVEKGLASLHEAVEKDPSDPLPWAGLALAYSLAAHGPSPPSDAFAQSKSAALEALALDGTVAQAHAALAQIRLYQDWDWKGAERAFERALALSSSLADTRAHYSWYLFLFGHTERALEEMRRAEETDPLAPLWSSWRGWQLWWAERFPEAIAEAERSLRLDPDFSPALWVLGAAYASQGMHDRAIETHERLARIDPLWHFAPGVSYALAGRHEEALEVIAKIEGSPEVWDTFFLAQVHAVLGNEDEAFQWLESAYEVHHPYIPWARNQILLAPLRDDPRFLELLRRMNLPDPSSS